MEARVKKPLASLKPTKPERLMVDRRRAGWTQQRCAKWWNVSLRKYRYWESGEAPDRLIPEVSVGTLTKLERCVIARHRRQLSQADVARQMGRSRWWVAQAERGGVPLDQLEQFWNEKLASC